MQKAGANLTRAVAEFAQSVHRQDISAEVMTIALDHIVDSYGVMLSGADQAPARIVREVFGTQHGPCTVIGTSTRQDPIGAALANGVAGHALDYDDTQLSTSPEGVYGLLTHPSVPVLAAVTSIAEDQRCDGEALVTAFIVGVEVACRIADAIAPRHYQAGFHSTGTMAGIGAVTGVGRLIGLSEARLSQAIGIAASMAAGLRENFGTMTKPLHSGRAAQTAVSAAMLAAQGFTASEEILDSPRGFFNAAGGGYSPERIEGRLGKPFFFADPGISIKPYPSGSLSHPAQDLILDIVHDRDLTQNDIQRIEVGTNSNVLNALIHHRPITGLQGKFSMEYCMATAVLRRRAGISEFTDEAVQDPEVQRFLPRVDVVVDPRIEAMGYQHVRTRVRVETVSGDVYEREAQWARGYPSRPLSADRLAAKFIDCAQGTLSEAKARDALEAIHKLPEAKKTSDVVRLLAPGVD